MKSFLPSLFVCFMSLSSVAPCGFAQSRPRNKVLAFDDRSTVQQHAPAPSATGGPETAGKHDAVAGIFATFVRGGNGLGHIDKGSAAGIRIGDRFELRRTVDTRLKTVSGAPLTRRKTICMLTISIIEPDSAGGECVPIANEHGPESVPKAGDDVLVVSNER